MRTRLRTGIIGCGKVAHLHASALTTLPESEFVGACDAQESRAVEFAKQYGIRAWSDPVQMIAEAGIEAVVICTPHPVHAAPAIAACEAGAHVLVEKPMASSVADCDAMIEAASRSDVLLGVVSQRRFFEPVTRMKYAIEAGKIGSPILGTVQMFSWRDEAYYRSDPWRGKWDTEGGGVLINQSPHHLDILLWMMGEVEEVVGRWANLNHPFVEVEDTAIGVLRFKGGGLGSITVSLCQRPGIYTKIHCHGSNGSSVGAETDTGATFIAGMSGAIPSPVNDLWTIPGEEHLLAEFQQQDRTRGLDIATHYHFLQAQDFLRAALERRPPVVTAEEGKRVVELITAIYESGRSGQPIVMRASAR